MVYWIVSPGPFILSPLSITVAVLIASIDGCAVKVYSVGSSVVFPSVSSPSSLISIISSVFPVLLAVTVTVLLNPPASTTAWLIT